MSIKEIEMKLDTEIVTKEKVVTHEVEEVVGLTLTKREALLLSVIGLYPDSVSEILREYPCREFPDLEDIAGEVRDFLQALPVPARIEQVKTVRQVNETLPSEPPEIRVGDLVKVVKRVEFNPDSRLGWAREMDKFVNDGNFYRVERVWDYNVRLTNVEWVFPHEALEIVRVG